MPPMLASLLANQQDSDDDDDEGNGMSASALPATTAPAVASSSGSDTQKEQVTEDRDSSSLPSADDLLSGGGAGVDRPDFLKMPEGPEFDASKEFKPPPVSHADLIPAVKGAGSRRPPPPKPEDKGGAEAPSQSDLRV